MFKTANNDSISRPNSRPKLPFPGNGKGKFKMPREGTGNLRLVFPGITGNGNSRSPLPWGPPGTLETLGDPWQPYLGQAKLLAVCSAKRRTAPSSPLDCQTGPGPSLKNPLWWMTPISRLLPPSTPSPLPSAHYVAVQKGVAVVPKTVTATRIEENAKTNYFHLYEIERFDSNILLNC